MKKLKNGRNTDIFFITRSLKQYNDDFNTEDFRKRNEYHEGFVVFDVMLDYNQKAYDPFSSRRLYKDLDMLHLCQSFFDLKFKK